MQMQMQMQMQTRPVATNESFGPKARGKWVKRRQLKPQHVKKIQGMRGGWAQGILGLPF
jgi:hypothetical protein